MCKYLILIVFLKIYFFSIVFMIGRIWIKDGMYASPRCSSNTTNNKELRLKSYEHVLVKNPDDRPRGFKLKSCKTNLLSFATCALLVYVETIFWTSIYKNPFYKIS